MSFITNLGFLLFRFLLLFFFFSAVDQNEWLNFFFFNIILINPILEHVRRFLCSEIIPFDWLVLISHPALQLTKLHQLAMQHPPFTPLGQTTPGFPGTYPWPPGDVLLLNSFVSRGHYIILITNVVNDQWSFCFDTLIFVVPSLCSITVPFITTKICFVCYVYLIKPTPFVPLAKNPELFQSL